MLFIVWGATHFNLPVTIASRFKGYPIIPRSAHFSEYVLCLAIAVVFLVYSELFSAAIGIVEQGHLQTKNRRQRALNHLISMGLFGAAMTLATGLSSLLFCLYYDLSVGDLTWTIVVLSVPATAALFAWTYRAWAASD